MSVEMVQYVLKHSAAKGSARNVLLAIADRADTTGACWPSVDDIAARANVCERTVQLVLHGLKAAGDLAYEDSPRGGRARPTLYVIVAGRSAEEVARVAAAGAERLEAWRRGRSGGACESPAEKGATACALSQRPASGKGASGDTKTAQSGPPKGAAQSAERAQALAPEPSVEPSGEPSVLTLLLGARVDRKGASSLARDPNVTADRVAAAIKWANEKPAGELHNPPGFIRDVLTDPEKRPELDRWAAEIRRRAEYEVERKRRMAALERDTETVLAIPAAAWPRVQAEVVARHTKLGHANPFKRELCGGAYAHRDVLAPGLVGDMAAAWRAMQAGRRPPKESALAI